MRTDTKQHQPDSHSCSVQTHVGPGAGLSPHPVHAPGAAVRGLGKTPHGHLCDLPVPPDRGLHAVASGTRPCNFCKTPVQLQKPVRALDKLRHLPSCIATEHAHRDGPGPLLLLVLNGGAHLQAHRG